MGPAVSREPGLRGRLDHLVYRIRPGVPRGERIERTCASALVRPDRAVAVVIVPRRAGLARLDLTMSWRRQCLIVREAVEWPEVEVLKANFEDVLAGPAIRFMPTRQLLEVVAASDAKDRLIAVVVSPVDESLVLYRGSVERLAVPMSWFEPSGTGVRPDFNDVEVIDEGRTLRLGRYEAAVEAILYEFDPEFRRRERARRLEQDASFGAALRRLRLQRGLRREDFTPVSAREVARIERGEVGRPHAETICRIAEHLGVAPGEIGTY